MDARKCLDCGATVVGYQCENCVAYLKLEQFGYKVGQASAGGYLLKDLEDTPILAFGSLGSNTVNQLVKRTGAPQQVVEVELAALAAMRSHEEETDEEEKLWVRYKPSVKSGDFIAEQVWDGRSAPRYVVRHFNREELEYKTEISLGETDDKGREIVYRPVYNDHLIKGMVTIPIEPTPCTFEEVIAEAFEFVENIEFYDPCGKIEEVKLLALISIGSWFLDRMAPRTTIPIAGVGRFAPILPIRGPSGTGKNRLANLLRFLSYRPYFDLSKTKIPSLFRPLDMWGGVLIIDEGDFKSTGATSALIHFLNARATGTPISRQNPDKVSESQAFESFGITMLTQRQHFDDNATEDRSLPYYSEKTMRKIPTVELDEIVERGVNLQNKLLYLRLKHWPEFEIDKRQWHEDLTDARLNAALLPVMTIGRFEPKVMEIVDATVSKIEEAKRRIKAQSDDGLLVNLLWEKLEAGLFWMWTKKYVVLEELIKGEDEEIPVALIASRIKERLGFEYRTISKIFNSLNMAPSDVPDRIRVGKKRVRPIFFRPPQMEKQLREFVVKYEPWSLYKILGLEPPKNGTDGTIGTGNSVCTPSGEDKKKSDITPQNPLHTETPVPTVPTVPTAKEEKVILEVIKREESLGIMALQGAIEYRLGRKYSDGEFEAILKTMSEQGLLEFDGKTVNKVG